MSIYQLKPAFQNLLRPLVRRLEQWGITANLVTLFACVFSLFLGMLLTLFPSVSGLFYLLPIWLFLRMALNAIDGMLAREFNQKSHLGGYLNEITDVASDTVLYLPFAFIAPFSASSVMGFIFLAIMTEFCGVLGQIHGNGRHYDGPLGKSDRAFLIGALGLAYAYFGSFPAYLSGLFWFANLALILTCYRRVKNGLNLSE
ncbi:CDP-alcohol phosphatidyltransferase [Rodentibacter pneumotropicus]|uniref:CDP-alcohol phosphatidyltransferase family protein n=1 Tax=Rodentibacter pneumotropicus TaxID=758 RepID=A0AAW5LCX7_9PAST|nr:CDP-alcohol phosphatidyltransferase family protein [Rodentibacter pneumotropicus]MCQ9121918.1 CDP-alcohol phosphatidyltransferase family protein [Rodentibacter pneumotropicus]OOF68099.1 CDP-alcohol phosphatidyltransferase [Rodentibacter pneumotropicus]